MVNLATLSALLRTIRQQGGGDGAAGPVERVAHVRRVAGDGEAQVAAQLRHDDARGRPLAALRADAAPAALRHAAPGTAPGVAGGAPDPAEGDAASASLDLTRAGALVAIALKGRTGTATPSALVDASAPLVPTARATAIDVARALARSIVESGLFYESHLARFARREYPASALGREPQAAWRPAADVASAPEAARSVPLPEAAVALLTRQLDALDARQLAWSGELWPGQRATIVLEEDRSAERSAEDPADGAAAATAWRTTITLDLPSLGPVTATLSMRGLALDLALRAPAADAHARLAEARGTLAAALADARIALHGFVVAD